MNYLIDEWTWNLGLGLRFLGIYHYVYILP